MIALTKISRFCNKCVVTHLLRIIFLSALFRPADCSLLLWSFSYGLLITSTVEWIFMLIAKSDGWSIFIYYWKCVTHTHTHTRICVLVIFLLDKNWTLNVKYTRRKSIIAIISFSLKPGKDTYRFVWPYFISKHNSCIFDFSTMHLWHWRAS